MSISKDIVLTTIEIAAKTALGVIPVGGTLMSCVWDSIKNNCGQKRLDDWKKALEDRLCKLETTLEEIGENEYFTTAMMKATDIAIKTMEKEKREFLADAVLNSVSCTIEESVLMMYFTFIDKYTLWHIKILNFFSNPKMFKEVLETNIYSGSPLDHLFAVYPSLYSNAQIVDKMIKELYDDGLLNTESMHCTMTSNGMSASRTTKLGNDFINFITQHNAV